MRTRTKKIILAMAIPWAFAGLCVALVSAAAAISAFFDHPAPGIAFLLLSMASGILGGLASTEN